MSDDEVEKLRLTLAENTQREALQEFRDKSRASNAEFWGRSWRSLKTAAGWVALVVFLGSAAYDMGSRVVHLIGRR